MVRWSRKRCPAGLQNPGTAVNHATGPAGGRKEEQEGGAGAAIARRALARPRPPRPVDARAPAPRNPPYRVRRPPRPPLPRAGRAAHPPFRRRSPSSSAPSPNTPASSPTPMSITCGRSVTPRMKTSSSSWWRRWARPHGDSMRPAERSKRPDMRLAVLDTGHDRPTALARWLMAQLTRSDPRPGRCWCSWKRSPGNRRH